MSMIHLKRDESTVIVELDPELWSVTARLIPFKFECSSEVYTELLFLRLRERLEFRMKLARAEAYRDGWSDRGAKRKKATWWSGDLP